MFFEAGCDGSEVLDFAEEAFNAMTVAIEERTEGGWVLASWHRLYVGDGTAIGEPGAKLIAVIGGIGEQDIMFADRLEHVGGALAIMGLARRYLQRHRQTLGIDKSVDLGRQPASRAPHASGVSIVPGGGLRPPFLAVAPCW